MTFAIDAPIILPMDYADLIKHYGSQAAIAQAVALKQPSIWAWQKSGVPAERQLEFQRLTNGKLKADPAIVKRYAMLLGKQAA